ncbi:MAG: DUF1749 domain-containing protein [Candidatus Aenigmarchaeota archaeon]|nr:DUF1749 domain-containing protein [Candidatus Aenigmarchaeota archaeon]
MDPIHQALRGELVKFFTADMLELQGLLCEPEAKTEKAVVYVHGTAGNFYENRLVNYIAESALKTGYAFLSFNNRGHDYFADIIQRTGEQEKAVTIGGAYERFEECIHDIEAALSYLEARGFNKFILAGHGLGPNKIVYSQHQRRNTKVAGLILLSPCNDVALQKSALSEKFDEANEKIYRMVEEGRGKEMLGEDMSPICPMSAQAYFGYLTPKGPGNTFPYHSPEEGFREITELELPMLVLFGSKDSFILPSVMEAGKIFKKKTRQARVGVIVNAGHNFNGFGKEVADIVTKWLGEMDKEKKQ